jgi:hypothetical protein
VAWADRSPVEQAALEYCVPKGIPFTVFWGRVVGHGEPQWTLEDRQAVFDWLSEQAHRCTDCGADLDDSLKVENRWAYEAEALWCHACRAIHRASVALADGKENPLAGARYRFKKTPEKANGHIQLAQ